MIKKLFFITLFSIGGVAVYSYFNNMTDTIVLRIIDTLGLDDTDAEDGKKKGSPAKLKEIKKFMRDYDKKDAKADPTRNINVVEDKPIEKPIETIEMAAAENQPMQMPVAAAKAEPIKAPAEDKKAASEPPPEEQIDIKKEVRKIFSEKELPEEKYYELGCQKLDKGDLKGAIKDFDKMISMNPKNAEAYYKRGIARHRMYNSKGALSDWDKAIALDPDYKDELQSAIAEAKAMTKKDYDKAISVNPSNSQAYYMRASKKYQKGDDRGALSDYDKAISINPNYAMAYYNRGIVKYRLANYGSAIEDFNKAIKLEPSRRNEIQAWIDLARRK